jgi:hypothetical protein
MSDDTKDTTAIGRFTALSATEMATIRQIVSVRRIEDATTGATAVAINVGTAKARK